MTTHFERRQFLTTALAAAAALSFGSAHAEGESALEKIKARGTLSVAVYNDYPPFNVKGVGIDVELAKLLAEQLGVKLSLLPFTADDSVGDDLRNMVWKGHYLGYGPADVMLHVPVDKPLMDAQDMVNIFGPYHRETVVIARQLDKLPQLDSLAPLKGLPIAAAGDSLAGWLMIGADNGAYRDNVQTKLANGVEAAKLLQSGQVVAAVGEASEIYSVLGQDPRFAITPLPVPRAPHDGWAIGMAVKRKSTDLARALQEALNTVAKDGRLGKLFTDAQVPWRQP